MNVNPWKNGEALERLEAMAWEEPVMGGSEEPVGFQVPRGGY